MGLRGSIRKLIRCTPYYGAYQTKVEKRRQQEELQGWTSGKFTVPPHLIKQEAIAHYADKHGLKILVETGTYLGEMIEAMRHRFDKVYSIELSEMLWKRAKRRFKGVANVELINGDSGKELGKLMERIDQPTLYWLDGHYSAGETAQGEKDTPIFEELGHIFNAPRLGHVIIVDDARLFGTDPAYPTIGELEAFVEKHQPGSEVGIDNDSIRIEPPSRPISD